MELQGDWCIDLLLLSNKVWFQFLIFDCWQHVNITPHYPLSAPHLGKWIRIGSNEIGNSPCPHFLPTTKPPPSLLFPLSQTVWGPAWEPPWKLHYVSNRSFHVLLLFVRHHQSQHLNHILGRVHLSQKDGYSMLWQITTDLVTQLRILSTAHEEELNVFDFV